LTYVAPSFDLISREYGMTRTIVAVGEIDLAVADHLEAAVHEALAKGPGAVVVDLSAVQFIDSTGISALVRIHRHAVACEVGLAIIPPEPQVQRIFALCGLDAVLPFTSTPAVAT
jgi:anti-sigma B factor antagonist